MERGWRRGERRGKSGKRGGEEGGRKEGRPSLPLLSCPPPLVKGKPQAPSPSLLKPASFLSPPDSRSMRSILAFVLLVATPVASAQTLELIGEVQFPVDTTTGPLGSGGSDVWAYTAPDGSEYALMGVLDGVAVVAVPSMEVVGHIPGPTLEDGWYHRDIKTRGHHAFITAENLGENEGLIVADLSGLPERVEVVAVGVGELISSHNLSVDVATGYAYVMNSSNNAVQIVDVREPENPTVVGTIVTGDLHDVYARNDTLWVAEGTQGSFSIWDVRDKEAPTMLTRVPIPSSGYVHNVWPSEDAGIAVTTEETQDHTIKVWDTSDLDNITLVGEYIAANGLAHNAHVAGRYAFVSHYSAGVVVLDLADPANPVEVARHDTYPANDDGGFHGNWGTVPPTPAGYVYGSDIHGKLTVLRFRVPEL
jgi:choice-of-anchor B domain-containing protein